MQNIRIYDRYASFCDETWIGRRWHSTREANCGCYLTGLITEVRPGAVRVRWSHCCAPPDSWEALERGSLMKLCE